MSPFAIRCRFQGAFLGGAQLAILQINGEKMRPAMWKKQTHGQNKKPYKLPSKLLEKIAQNSVKRKEIKTENPQNRSTFSFFFRLLTKPKTRPFPLQLASFGPSFSTKATINFPKNRFSSAQSQSHDLQQTWWRQKNNCEHSKKKTTLQHSVG
jgi:hypothetical protein